MEGYAGRIPGVCEYDDVFGLLTVTHPAIDRSILRSRHHFRRPVIAVAAA